MQIVLCLGIFSYILYIAKACSCYGKPHFQTDICEAEYAIKVRVLKKEEIYSSKNEEPIDLIFNIIPKYPDEIEYTIEVLREFKVSPEYLEADKRILYTEGTGAMCGVNLQVKSAYLITGVTYDNKLRTGLCNLVKKWRVDRNTIDNNHVLERKQKRFFKQGLYLENCDCPVNDCTNMGCYLGMIPGPSRYCLLIGDESQCYKKHSYCKQTVKHGCKWKWNNRVEECLQLTS